MKSDVTRSRSRPARNQWRDVCHKLAAHRIKFVYVNLVQFFVGHDYEATARIEHNVMRMRSTLLLAETPRGSVGNDHVRIGRKRPIAVNGIDGDAISIVQ